MTHHPSKDLLIIGQGIAGSMLAWHASQACLSFDIFDKGSETSASAVSSGIINPITGPKYIKSWLIDELLPYAEQIYTSIENELGIRLVNRTEIWRHIPSINADNLWDERLQNPGYDEYVSRPKSADVIPIFPRESRFGIVKRALQINVAALLAALRRQWLDLGVLQERSFDEDILKNEDGLFFYEDRIYRNIVLAMGYKGISTKWFQSNDYTPVKGEVLICKIEDLSLDQIFKYGKFIVPLGDHQYWIGSNYQHQFKDPQPDLSYIQSLINFLEEDIRLPYEIIQHQSGVRPSTKYRRPFIGQHPKIKSLYLLNGLGTKGISLAPYFSNQLIRSITRGTPMEHSESFNKTFLDGQVDKPSDLIE